MKMVNYYCRMGVMFCMTAMLYGCNSYNVEPLPYDRGLVEVTVIENPKVKVTDFVDVMVDEFGARNIKVRCVPESYVQQPDEYVIKYDARQSWDFSSYLSDATIRISKDNFPVAKGKYHHVGQSCSFDLFTKWRGTEWKMKDLYDELLQNYPKRK